MNFNSFPFQKLDTHGAVWEFSLLLPCCHQMELTSGCYTVLCHCAYAQNMLTAKLQTRTGSKTGVPPQGRLYQLSPFPGTGRPEVRRARAPHSCNINFELHSTSGPMISWLFSLENQWPQPATRLMWPESISWSPWKHSYFEPRVGKPV